MRKIFFIAATISLTALFSCSDPHGKNFIGSWKTNGHDSIKVTIERNGETYLVTTWVHGVNRGMINYKLADSVLVNPAAITKIRIFMDTIKYNHANDDLAWEGLAWERTR